MQEKCVLCGKCFVSCPQKAKRIRNDLPKAQALVAGDAPVYASLAPAFVANYPGQGIAQMGEALKSLGFAGAEETAIGATIVKRRFDAMVDAEEKPVIIDTCCPTVNMLAEKYFPAALPDMAQVISPMQAHAQSIRMGHPDAKVIFIGPCISKKAEAEDYPGYVDCVLTFRELSTWFAQEGVVLPESGGPADEEASGKARLFPTLGGVLRSMEKKNPHYSYIAVDGIIECLAAFKDISEGHLSNCFIEMSACSGSCIGGPAMSHDTGRVRGSSAINAYATEGDFATVDIPVDEMAKKLEFDVQPDPKFSDEAITETLRKIGKAKPEDELNCGSCGYDTCREKAAAVLTGKATLEMCLPYLMSRVQSFSDTIIKNMPSGIVVLNEDMEIQQINNEACRIFNVKKASDVAGQNVVCLMAPTLFFKALDGDGKVFESRQYLAEYRRFVQITVLHDKENSLIIGILRDVTETETALVARREAAENTVRVTDEVIAKQMRTVQEIASLLGETAAETKIALTKLKETLNDD
jgi:iron only hydrogenase large subunit-like protein/uncharacterized Fe-S cluster-containing protein